MLRLMEQLRNVEIAQLLGIPPNAVAIRYRKALERLRAILPADVFEEIRTARSAVVAPACRS